MRKTLVFLSVVLPLQLWGAPPRILLVSPEQTTILQTGGLAHATTGLAVSLRQEGYPTDILMPQYLEMQSGPLEDARWRSYVDVDWRAGVAHKRSFFSLARNTDAANPTLFLKHEPNQGQSNYFDNRTGGQGKKFYAPEATIGESFGAFDKAAANYILSQNYDVVILNDWTTGLIATHLEIARHQGLRVPKVVFAIHNLAYQGLFPRSLADFLGLDPRLFAIEGYEFWDRMSFLKAGLQSADMIYTVSAQYAKEITTRRFGAGLDGLIRQKEAQGKVRGILNGILNEEWEPTLAQKGLETTFSKENLAGKAAGKRILQKQLGLEVSANLPLFVLTSRLAEQKGFEYLVEAIDQLAQDGGSQWVIIGDGDERYREQLRALAVKFPKTVRYQGFSSLLEKQLTRYGDFFVNGAWFEPSGLNQFFALRNGTIPVVSAAGGLLDSVQEGLTGLRFEISEGENGAAYDSEVTRDSAVATFNRAVQLFKDPDKLQLMRRRGMAEDHSWNSRIRSEFRALFAEVLPSASLPPHHAESGMCAKVFSL